MIPSAATARVFVAVMPSNRADVGVKFDEQEVKWMQRHKKHDPGTAVVGWERQDEDEGRREGVEGGRWTS